MEVGLPGLVILKVGKCGCVTMLKQLFLFDCCQGAVLDPLFLFG